jgi:hypothetical protein
MKPTKDDYARAVCYFLAEQLRTHKTNLRRAAEVAQKVVDNINLLDTEADFLRFIKDLSSDFQELAVLEERIFMGMHFNQRKDLEMKVRDFVAHILPQNSNLALQVLQESVKDGVQIENLSQKFPEFRQFILNQKPYAR